MSQQRIAPSRRRRAGPRRETRSELLERRTLLAAMAWTGGAGDGLWNTPGNWSTATVPASGDDVTIAKPGNYTVALSGSAATVKSLTLGASGGAGTQTLSISSSLTLADESNVQATGRLLLNSGGTLAGNGALNVGGEMHWLGGTMSGGGATVVNGTMRISGSHAKSLRRTITNGFSGTLQWTGGGDIVFTGGQINNSGFFEISGDGAIVSGGGSNLVSTVGPVTQSGNTSIGVRFEATAFGNTTVNGTLVLAGGGLSRVSFDVAGALVVRGATYEVLGAGTIEGSGVARFDGGAHLLATSNVIAPQRLEIRNTGTDVEIYQFDVGELSVVQGALLRFTRGPSRTAAIEIDSNSRLDFATSGLIVDYDVAGNSALAQVQSLLSSGYADGAWNGRGISSSAIAAEPGRAIGYAESADLFAAFPATFLGRPVDDTAVLIRSTLSGDANLDGLVNLSDFNRLATSFGQTDALWGQGNFNYDAVTNLADFNRLAGNFGGSVSAPSAVWSLDDIDESQAFDRLT